MGLILGGVSASDLIMDGKSVSLYVGGNPPTKVWPTRETVQITLGTNLQARDQFRAALSDRGLDYRTVTEIPFDIELVGTGSAQTMFQACSALTTVPAMDTSNVTNMAATFFGCTSLTTVPAMDTSQVTNMSNMFQACSALTYVPDMDTSQVTNMYAMFIDCSSLTHVPDMDTRNVTYTGWMFQACSALTSAPSLDTRNVTSTDGMFWNCSSLTTVPDMDAGNITSTYGMFWGCSALTDGNVRLIGKHPEVFTGDMITDSGLTREPWYTAGGAPIDVYEVSFYGEYGRGKLVPLVNVTIPAGEEWAVRVQGSFTRTTSWSSSKPQIRIGTVTSGAYSQGEVVDFSGTVSSSDSTIAAVMNRSNSGDLTDFVGTVTIEK